MSSANLVEIIGVPEIAYGVTPDLNTAQGFTYRFTSESLSGTPTTTESEELRTDRMSGGQVVVGLEVGGDINFELSKDISFDTIFLMAMMDTGWHAGAAAAPDAVTLTKDAVNPQLATAVFTTLDVTDIDGNGLALAPGDVITLSGFTNAGNNGPRQIVSVTAPGTVQMVVPREAVTETAAAVILGLGDWIDIGATIRSLTNSKAYKDVTHLATTDQHSQRYTGSIVSGLSMAMAYGAIVTGTATFAANGYLQEAPSLHQQIDAAGGAIEPAGTANPLNASVDMGTVTVDGQPTDFCIESLNWALDNGLTPQNCIGKIAPTKYAPGTAAITIDTSIYLSDTSYDAFMAKKLSQAPIGLLMAASNLDGGYAFDFRAIQLTFPDPAAGGQNQQVMIDASGVGKVGAGGASTLRIWKWEA